MSKSLGNVVDPSSVIEGGKNQKTDYTVPYHELPRIDQHALFQLENVVKRIQVHYESYQFFKIFQILQRFVIVVDLSNFYFDVAKDRLYVRGSTSYTRRSCQTVLAAHLLSIVRVIAPILPHLAEDVWQNLPFQYATESGSFAEYVFESSWPTLNEIWLALSVEEIEFWEKILEAEILPSLEDEHIVNIPYSGECIIQRNSKVWIGISCSGGSKCERCWNYSHEVGLFSPFVAAAMMLLLFICPLK